MNDATEKFLTWQDVIDNFFITKIYAEEEKYIKILIKEIEDDCKKKDYYNNATLKSYFVDAKSKKEKQEKSIDFQRRRIEELFVIKDSLQNLALDDAILGLERERYAQKVSDIAKKYEPVEWFSKASKSAVSVTFATHVSKLTHSKIDSPSIYDKTTIINSKYLTTSSLKVKAIDGAVAGNQFAPIFQLLELECNGVKLATELCNPHSDALKSFAKENEYLAWNNGFSRALTSGEPASHLLAKQVYFPIQYDSSNTTKYHLLCNLKSSSIAQAIFDGLFSDTAKNTQKSLQDAKFAIHQNRYYPNKSKLGVTASNHSNASQLNANRGGKLYLFSSAPPTWQSQAKPPVYKSSFFNHQLRYFVSTNDIDYLRDFLIRFDKSDLSIKNPERKKWIDAWVSSIVDDVLAYAATIQHMQAGWSATEDIKLKYEHQLFLDPYRHDEAFQALRKTNDWQSVICADFARWLNYTLSGKDKQFSPQQVHTKMWTNMMEDALRDYDELIQIDIKTGSASL